MSSHKDGGADVGRAADGPQEAPSDDVDDFGKAKDGGAEAACRLSHKDAGPGGGVNWAHNFGSTGQTIASAVAIDPLSGDIVTAGYFQGSVDFGGGLKHSEGDGYPTFVAKFDSSGAYTWAKSFGNGLATNAGGVAVDSVGNVLVGGVFAGTLNFGCGTVSAVGDQDIFLVKFKPGGACSWSKSFGAAGQTQNLDTVAVDPSGDVVIAGIVSGGVTFGGGALTGDFIAKFASGGGYVWSNAFSASSTSSIPVLAVDEQGNMILAGSFSGSANFGGGTLKSAGSSDVFLAKYDSTGAYLWAKRYGDSSEQNPTGVATDSCGNIFVVGELSGSINFGSGTGTLTATAPNSYAFLAKIDPAGDAAWAEEFIGSPGTLSAGGVAVDAEGGPTITALLYSSGTANFGGGSLSSTSGTSVAVASFDAAGAYRWAYSGGPPSTAGSSSPAYLQGIAAHASKVVVVGAFGTCTGSCATSPAGTTLVLGTSTLTAASGQDLFLASFSP